MGKIIGIFTAPDKGKRMQSHTTIKAIAGKGLEGDRYALQRGSWKAKDEKEHKKKRNVTLIATEDIVAANLTRGDTLRFNPWDTRRNLLTINVALRELIGHVFQVGTVRMRAVEEATPCDRPDKLSGKIGFKRAFQGRGGILCEILSDGDISLGDRIEVVS